MATFINFLTSTCNKVKPIKLSMKYYFQGSIDNSLCSLWLPPLRSLDE